MPIDELERAYRLMLLSRTLDEHCEAMLRAGEAVPHFHAGVGQEAVSVGAVTPLAGTDELIYTHRGYASLLAKGVPVQQILRDMFMRVGGTNAGLGGVMHVCRPDLGVPGREGVFGTRFPLAVGLALASRLQGADKVVVCLYGEAAGARGPLYEALNMAVLWSLPVVFVAENNGWSFSSRTEWLYPEGRMTRVWKGFDIPVHEIDGNDTEAVIRTVGAAVQRARSGQGPSVIEAMTYRISPHIWWDQEEYRDGDEVQAWRDRDPLVRTHARLLERGVPQDHLDRISAGVKRTFLEAMEDLQEAPAATWSAESVVA
ncbi:thiamine pyrophosphate-dependent dehydrogenase E1 component subunit alpha [Micromonospora sp. NPDC005299]|uniref:thiamine pyrophosphate-dependent dehydrogenase E1 component subunit alpha n=1 Tax=Micromonospora sp. NPDC005299 TaxID=3364231 RepID=UPI0036CE97BD